jgi:hypothetical protein
MSDRSTERRRPEVTLSQGLDLVAGSDGHEDSQTAAILAPCGWGDAFELGCPVVGRLPCRPARTGLAGARRATGSRRITTDGVGAAERVGGLHKAELDDFGTKATIAGYLLQGGR